MQETKEQLDIVTETHILRSAPPARLGGNDYLLSFRESGMHTTFDTAAGPSEASESITLYSKGESTIIVPASSLPEKVVEGLATVPRTADR